MLPLLRQPGRQDGHHPPGPCTHACMGPPEAASRGESTHRPIVQFKHSNSNQQHLSYMYAPRLPPHTHNPQWIGCGFPHNPWMWIGCGSDGGSDVDRMWVPPQSTMDGMWVPMRAPCRCPPLMTDDGTHSPSCCRQLPAAAPAARKAGGAAGQRPAPRWGLQAAAGARAAGPGPGRVRRSASQCATPPSSPR